MKWGSASAGVLASCVNDGGVFVLDPTGVQCLSARDTTGMCHWPRGMIWARQDPGSTELGLVGDDGLHNVRLTDHALDLHDALWHDGALYLVATQTNTVSAFDLELKETQRWVFEGEADSQHLNSICVHDGRLLASRFGDFRQHRGYKGRTRGTGQVIDVRSGQVVIEGLSQPHSLRSHAGLLWLCDSETHRVLAFRDGAQVQELQLDGYARGLLVSGDRMLVGLSRSRNVDSAGVGNACVVELAGAAWRETARVQLPAAEVYELAPCPAQLPDLSQQALAEARTLIHAAAHGRNVAAADAHEWRQRFDTQAAEMEQLHREVQQHTTQNRRACARLSEAEAWTGLLEKEVAALRGRLDAAQGAMRAGVDAVTVAQDAIQAGRAAVGTRDAYIRLLRGSRTWRWTGWLRRNEASQPLALPDDGNLALRQLERARGATWQVLESPPVPEADHAAIQIEDIAFVPQAEPVVSVLITAFGAYDHTRACLESIAQSGDATPFEVLLVEDASQERRMERFSRVPGLRYMRNPANLGFLRSVNAAAAQVRGQYLLLLNNDTRVQPGWLDALVRSFALLDGCGLAGSKLVFPDGSLQEAGGAVWSDATGWNIGRGEDPRAAAFKAARRVDYVSGASCMIETSLFRELGGFDERFAPAYYEDTDLAFRVRQRGKHVYYQPESVVEHIEGLSHGTDESTGGKAAQARNRAVFLDTWRDELERSQLAPGEHAFLARERGQLAKSVLVVDHYAPRCDQDAGSKAIWALLRTLQQLGFWVRFWSLIDNEHEAYADTLRRHGIDVEVGDAEALSRWLGTHGAYVDNVILSRPAVAIECLMAVRATTRARVVFYGHDIHHQRIAGHARVSADPGLVRQEHALREMEQGIWRGCDVILYPTDEETAAVDAWLASNGVPDSKALTIPLLAFDRALESVDGSPVAIAARDQILFVGNYQHAPNDDGAVWFAREIWPALRGAHAGLRLVLAGAGVTSRVADLAADAGVEVAGRISDAELDLRYARARVVIAPLRFGAGLKGKVVEAMRHGVPVVTTSIGAQGLRDATCLSVADDPAAFGAALSHLVADQDAWRTASIGGQRYVADRFSTASIAAVLATFMDPTPYPDVEARRERLSRPPASVCGDAS